MFGLRMSVLFSLLLAVAGLQSSRLLTGLRRAVSTPPLARGHAGYGVRESLATGGRAGHTDAITQPITPGAAKPPTPWQIAAIDYNPHVFPGSASTVVSRPRQG